MLTNIVLALWLITILSPLALFGILGLAAVVLVHELAEIVVIANGVRAGRTKPLASLPDSTAKPAPVLAGASTCPPPRRRPPPSHSGVGSRRGPLADRYTVVYGMDVSVPFVPRVR